MNIKIIFLLISCMVVSCKKDYVDENLSQIIGVTQVEIKKRYNAQCSSIGIGALNGVKRITLSFSMPTSPTLEDARRIMVNSILILQKNINSNIPIRPYLSEYPFPASRTSIAFWIKDERNYPIKTVDVINSFSFYGKMIVYTMLKKKTVYEKEDKEIIVHQESFEEAMRIIENEHIH